MNSKQSELWDSIKCAKRKQIPMQLDAQELKGSTDPGGEGHMAKKQHIQVDWGESSIC